MRREFKIGEIVGFRYWVFCNASKRLHGPHSYVDWPTDRPMEGKKCKFLEKAGHAGVYAAKDSDDIYAYLINGGLNSIRRNWWYKGIGDPVCVAVGSIKMWGTVFEHHNGYRSQFASVRSIYEIIPGPDFHLYGNGAMISEIRKIYKVQYQ